jgi:Flp pilus assembly pilin Flp
MSLFTPRRVIEFGLLVSMVGAFMIAIGAISFLRTPTPATGLRQRWGTLAGALAT